MSTVWRILRGAGVVIGPIITVASVSFAALKMVEVGLSWYWWVAIGGGIFFASGFAIIYGQHKANTKLRGKLEGMESATPEALKGLRLVGLSLRITDLTREQDVIEGRTFESCHFHGPAIISFTGTGTIIGNSFDANLDLLFIEVPERSVWGAIIFHDCTLLRCTFHNIGIVGTAALKEQLRTGSTDIK